MFGFVFSFYMFQGRANNNGKKSRDRVSLSFHIYTSVVFMQLQQKDFARAPRDLLQIPLKGITNRSLLSIQV
jgi:hypothetical protein